MAFLTDTHAPHSETSFFASMKASLGNAMTAVYRGIIRSQEMRAKRLVEQNRYGSFF